MTIETTGIKVNGINFIILYITPNSNKNNFVDLLSAFLDTLNGQKIIIGGDYNLNALNPNAWLDQLCNNYNLKTEILRITRIQSGT